MFRFYDSECPKQTGKIISRANAMQMLQADENTVKYRLNEWNKNNRTQFQLIPCKKCWACQLNYSAEWATRIMLECKDHENNWFITLTYDDDHLPIAEKIGDEKGREWINDGTWIGGTLNEPDMVKFLNSLRKHFERQGHTGIKYFYAGEYGETTHRPHYHIILMNCPLKPEFFYDAHVDKNFKAHWKSTEVEQYWKEGMIDVAEVEWSSAAYVARYCTKKLSFDTDKTVYYENGRMPEFVRMSKGIGFEYLNRNREEIYKTDSIVMKTVKGNLGNIKPPKAFDRKLEQVNPELMEMIKESRKKAAERAREITEQLSDYTDLQNLIMSAERVKMKMQMLPRVGEW